MQENAFQFAMPVSMISICNNAFDAVHLKCGYILNDCFQHSKTSIQYTYMGIGISVGSQVVDISMYV